MNPVEYFSNIIRDTNYNISTVSEAIIDNKETLIRCFINPWNGFVTVLEHKKNPDGSFDEPDRIIGSISIDDEDNLITEISKLAFNFYPVTVWILMLHFHKQAYCIRRSAYCTRFPTAKLYLVSIPHFQFSPHRKNNLLLLQY
jgi:hypothetical protein